MVVQWSGLWASTVVGSIPGQAELRSCMLHGVAKKKKTQRNKKEK